MSVEMSHLPPAGWAQLARRSDVEHETALLRADLRGEMAGLRTDLKSELTGLRTDLKSELAGLRADLRGEMVTQTRWMVSVLTVLATVLTAANVLT